MDSPVCESLTHILEAGMPDTTVYSKRKESQTNSDSDFETVLLTTSTLFMTYYSKPLYVKQTAVEISPCTNFSYSGTPVSRYPDIEASKSMFHLLELMFANQYRK